MPSRPSVEEGREREEKEKRIREAEKDYAVTGFYDVASKEIDRAIVLTPEARKQILDLFSGAELPTDTNPTRIANFLEKSAREFRKETAQRLIDGRGLLAEREDPQYLDDLATRKEALGAALGRKLTMRRHFSGGPRSEVVAGRGLTEEAKKFQELPQETLYKKGEHIGKRVDKLKVLFEIEFLRNSILREKPHLLFLKPEDYRKLLSQDEHLRMDEAEEREASKIFRKKKSAKDLMAESIRNDIERAARLIGERELFLKYGKVRDWSKEKTLSDDDQKRLEEEARRAVNSISVNEALPDVSQAKRLIHELDKLTFMKAGG